MKKKLVAVLAAAMVMVMGSASVFAASSPMAGLSTPEEAAATVTEVSGAVGSTLSTANYEKVEEQVKALNKTGQATLLAALDLNGTPGQTITLKISGISASGNYKVWHLNGTTWELADNITFTNGQISFSLKSFSPVMVVADTSVSSTSPSNNASSHTVHYWQEYTVAPTATTWGYTMHYCAGCGESYADSYIAPTSAAGAAVASPKTAETASMLPVLAMVCAAGAVVCTRKYAMGR